MKPIFKRYHEIDQKYILSDFHMHSTWTDGVGSIEENILAAKKNGLNQIAATDHIRHTSTYFEGYCEEIQALRERFDFPVFIGFEAKVDDFQGTLDVSDSDLQRSELSICSVHRYPIGRKLIPAKAFSSQVSQEIELELTLAALNRGGFSVMGHPGGMSLRTHNEFHKDYFEEIIVACQKNGIAFDFNSSYHQDVKLDLVELFTKYNPLISIGSDAHHPDLIGNASKTLF